MLVLYSRSAVSQFSVKGVCYHVSAYIYSPGTQHVVIVIGKLEVGYT